MCGRVCFACSCLRRLFGLRCGPFCDNVCVVCFVDGLLFVLVLFLLLFVVVFCCLLCVCVCVCRVSIIVIRVFCMCRLVYVKKTL